jgi:CubicO group peptidase (beta-lactamase class C family)
MRLVSELESDERESGDNRARGFAERPHLAATARGGSWKALCVVALITSFVVLAAFPAVAQEGLSATRPEDVGMSSERLERIVPGMKRLIDAGKIPGTVTLVARHGKIVHFEAAGSRNIEAGQPMTKDTIFRLYSQSKPITGVATMILFEEGHFLLTDPISNYLPEFANMRVYTGVKDGEIQTEEAQPITIQHLLTHTSGLTYDFFPTPVGKMYKDAGVVGVSHGTRFQNLAEWSQALAKMPLVAQPGTEWNYSVGMDVLGRLVEVVSGKTYRSFLKERIFDPLGMQDTDFYVPDEKVNRFAANYGPKPGGGMVLIDDPTNSPYRKLPVLEMGGSGLVGTAADYLRFAQMLANGGELGGVRILGSQTVKLMMMDHLNPEFPPDPLSSIFNLLGSRRRAWGVGFGLTGSVVTDPALTGLPVSKGVFSWGGAATTHFWVDPEEDLVAIVHTQLLPDGTYPVVQLMQVLTYQAITGQ